MFYTKQEKEIILTEYKESGKSISEFSRVKNIPTTTIRGWLKTEQLQNFGEINLAGNRVAMIAPKNTVVSFATETVKIELKEGFDKEQLRKLMEVLLNVE